MDDETMFQLNVENILWDMYKTIVYDGSHLLPGRDVMLMLHSTFEAHHCSLLKMSIVGDMCNLVLELR